MTYNNKLVSGDNKGYAEVQFERSRGVTYDKRAEFELTSSPASEDQDAKESSLFPSSASPALAG